MGIHYDYKSTRGDKAMKKEAKRKARIEQRRARKNNITSKNEQQEVMHDINKPITLEDLTNPDKKQKIMKISEKKDSFIRDREAALKKNLKKRKKINKKKNKDDSTFR